MTVRAWKLGLLWLVLVVLGLILYNSPIAEAGQVFDIKEVSVTYRSFFPGGTDPMITDNPYQPNKALDKELDLAVNMEVFQYFYWNNTIHSMTDKGLDGSPGQFRMVGLETGLGIDFRSIWALIPASMGYYHYSRHELDTSAPVHFPVLDAIELKLYLYQGR